MESIEDGTIDESVTDTTPPTTIDEAAVIINDESNNDSTTSNVANTTTIADEENVISDEITATESQQMSVAAAAEGKEETDDAVCDVVEATLTTSDDLDTTASTTKNEQAAQENMEAQATAPNSNDVDLLGFTDQGAATNTNFSTDNNPAEIMSSFPENSNNTTVETTASSSNEFDLLGSGAAAETPQGENTNQVDDNSAVDENENKLNDNVGTEDREKNDAIIAQRPDSDVAEEECLEIGEETFGSQPIPNQGDTDEADLLNMARANNEVVEDDLARPESEHTETGEETVTPDVPNESGTDEDLLTVDPNEVSETIATLPENAEHENYAEDSTQLNSEEVISNDGDVSEAIDAQPILNDVITPDSKTIHQTHDIETVEETVSPDVTNESGAGEDLLSVAPNEVSEIIATLPENADNEVDAEVSTQLNSEEVINNDDDISEAADTTDTQPNNNDVTMPDSKCIHQTQDIETIEETVPEVPNESGAGEDLLSVDPNEVSETIVTMPESADNEADAEDSAQLNSEEAINNDVGVSVATDMQPNMKDVTTPDSESIDQANIETVEETVSPDVTNESGAGEDLLSATGDDLSSVEPNEVSETIVTLPESAKNEVDAEDSAQLNSEEVVVNNDGDVSEDIDTQPNGETLPSALSGGVGIEQVAMEETMGLNCDKEASEDAEDAQTNVQDMCLPTDEPTATFAELPEGHLNVANNNVDLISEAPDTQTNEVGNANIQDAIQQEEGEDDVENVEEKDVINLTPIQNNEEGNPVICAPAETHTQEEAEWLSMGLTLGDSLRQIVALTVERDSALAICQEKDDVATQAESLLVEVQARLEAEMNRRAESDSKARKLVEKMNTYEERLEAYEKMEDELEAARANLVTTVSEKSKLELEIAKLREVRDESERKEAVLSNRLNEAKKKEANKSNTAGRLELDNEELRANLESTKAELESTSKAKAKLEGTMEKLKTKAVERVKQAETALKEERELNEERKRKMKVFVETKAEELREAKESAGDMQKELQETRSSLSASREREELIQNDLESARIKYREVQRDMERMKRNAEALHNMGNNLEQELEKSANETEEHKKKRISAKHELMTMMRTLEVEKGVSEKLRESMKFTFAPKAQSQQQLLSECLRDLEQELDRLSIKLGKSLLPQTQSDDSGPSKNEEGIGLERSESNGSGKKARRGRAAKADMDTERLVSNLEQETQSVSKGIMALVSSIERMRILLDEDNTFNCMAFFSNQLGLTIGAGEARHQRLGDETTADDHEEAVSITSFEQR